MGVGTMTPIAQTYFNLLTTYTSFGQKGADVMAPGGDLTCRVRPRLVRTPAGAARRLSGGTR